jgi:C4-dicarboxylate-specific signal transduction histidine kinase
MFRLIAESTRAIPFSLDITELRRVGRELTAAQKLESVGRLAAGIAHEINTPVQFVSDNVQFVRTSMTEIGAVIRNYRELQRTVQRPETSAWRHALRRTRKPRPIWTTSS